jgi:hypothetical protein
MSERMSIEQYKGITRSDGTASRRPKSPLPGVAPRAKYGNIKTERRGRLFDSKAEADRYDELVLLKRTGDIQGFACQPSFVLHGGIRYRPDFIVCDEFGFVWVEDVKGFETKDFIMKRKLWEEDYPWMELRIIK